MTAAQRYSKNYYDALGWLSAIADMIVELYPPPDSASADDPQIDASATELGDFNRGLTLLASPFLEPKDD